jgi:hypothetical protein
MVNACEPLIYTTILITIGNSDNLKNCHYKCREEQQAKETDRLEPKGKRPGIGVRNSSIADEEAPAERWDLSIHVLVIKRNLVSLYSSQRESKPQGEPSGMQVWDVRKSECFPVMGKTGCIPNSKEC